MKGEVIISLFNYRGNIRKLISRGQEIAQFYDYTAFGEEISPSTSLHNPWRYSAKRYDPHLQLYDFGKRFYDPFNGRWITTDPVGFADGTNLYTYAHNSPLSYFDPDGRFVFAIPLIGITAEAIFYACIGATATYSAAKIVESNTRAGTIPRSTGEIATELFGTALGGIAGNIEFEYTPGSSNQIVSVFGTPTIITRNNTCSDISTYKNKQKERQSSDESGAPPYRGDKLPIDGSVKPAEGFEWKGKGKSGSNKGNWVKGSGNKQETLHPDFDHAPPQGKHWDYQGPGFPKGARLYLDGTWELK